MNRKTGLLIAATVILLLIQNTAAASCGDKITKDTDLREDLLCTEEGLTVTESNVTLNCHGNRIKGLDSYRTGLKALNVGNITVKNCRVSGFNTGIKLENVNKSLLVNNSVKDSRGAGIRLESSYRNRLVSNTANRNWDGFFLQNSSSNIITGSKASYNEVNGVHIFYGSKNNVIEGNNLTWNYGHGLAPATCGNKISENLAGTGKPIKYVQNSRNVEIKDTAAFSEIIFCNVSNSLIDNVSISNGYTTSDGILLVSSTGNTIRDSRFRSVRTAVYLFRNSNNNKVSENSIYSSDIGVRIRYNSKYNKVSRNRLNDTEIYFKTVRNSENNLFISNTIEGKEKTFKYRGEIKVRYINNTVKYSGNVTETRNRSQGRIKGLIYVLGVLILVFGILGFRSFSAGRESSPRNLITELF
ncbi:MAG: nitrous oxide reductase family maturation protein NosD [Candidatus Nanohalobium sp.]